ncbi:hypothetical protein K438DRAFT_671851 [Mycena galopus ATCC 62051]|nr:hypothetical protein K438DRAFT_671851 [Mycena galopus ATCC 62051]
MATHLAFCPNSRHPEDEICNCINQEFDIAVAAKPTLSLPSTPSAGSTRSKRSIWSDDEGSSSDSGHDQKRVKSRSLSPFFSRIRSFREIDAFLYPPGGLLVDKTQWIIDLPQEFRYLVLRPPQFGKSMFLSALCHFYDIHGAKHFDERFGSLAVVTQAPTPVPHSQHLCLSFNLSDFWVCSTLTEIMSDLPKQISHVLDSFLIEYAGSSSSPIHKLT